LIFKFFFFLS